VRKLRHLKTFQVAVAAVRWDEGCVTHKCFFTDGRLYYW
jgi:hypothetical protein